MSTFIFFKDSYFFVFFFLLPLLVFLFVYFQYRRERVFKKIMSLNIIKKLHPRFSRVQKIIRLCIQGIILSFMIIALSRPYLKDQKVSEKSEGIEVIMAIDVSQSMLTQDVLPNRLSLVKTELSRFLSQSQRRDRIGLIAFAGSAFLISPLTFDINIIQTYLNALSPDILTSQGSNFKSAFETALKSFEGIPNSEKVFILASDGEDHEVGALEMARRLHEKGVRIFTLGVGTEKGGPIQIREGPFRDSDRNVVISQFKDRSLKEFAQIGKGAFYHLSANSAAIPRLNEDLNLLEKNVFEANGQQSHIEIFQIFLLLSLMLIFGLWIKGYETF